MQTVPVEQSWRKETCVGQKQLALDNHEGQVPGREKCHNLIRMDLSKASSWFRWRNRQSKRISPVRASGFNLHKKKLRTKIIILKDVLTSYKQ